MTSESLEYVRQFSGVAYTARSLSQLIRAKRFQFSARFSVISFADPGHNFLFISALTNLLHSPFQIDVNCGL